MGKNKINILQWLKSSKSSVLFHAKPSVCETIRNILGFSESFAVVAVDK